MDATYQSQPAEERLKTELEALQATDQGERPPGWHLSPRKVEEFILGSAQPLKVPGQQRPVVITPKYVGDRERVQLAIATLATNRGLLLVGPPGTAKSQLSEWLAAAISGCSTLVVQGTSGTTEDHVKYSWNYALLLKDGPVEKSLKPSPVLLGMRHGMLVRFEEMTRCSSEVQDALISILSERMLSIPEMGQVLRARRGFNVIATANTRDRGVHEMSSALARRFHFVTMPILEDPELVVRLVERRTRELLDDCGLQVATPRPVLDLLERVVRELRQGQTDDGTRVRSPKVALSPADSIAVLQSSAMLARFFAKGSVELEHVARSLVGVVARESEADLDCLESYLETVARTRQEAGWSEFYRRCTRELKAHREQRKTS